jgi:hypothetical protein
MITRSAEGAAIWYHRIGARQLGVSAQHTSAEVPMRPLVFLPCLLMTLYGLVWCVNDLAYLVGAGTEVTVHIEHTKHGEGVLPTGDGGSMPVQVTTNEGYYTDSSGERHAISLHDEDLAPGMTVQIRLPLLGGDAIVPIPRAWWQAVGGIVFGFICIGMAVLIFWVFD